MNTRSFLRRQIVSLAYRQLPVGELIARAAAGDSEAFVAVVCRKYPVVEKIAREELGPGGPAEDVALEVFLHLWRQRAEVRDPLAIDRWLTRTAQNVARNMVAAQTRGRAAGREWWHRSGEAAAPKPPDRAAIQEEMIRRVRLALSQQSDRDQRVLKAAEQAGDDARAAESLGLSVSTYRVRLHRARQRLRILLKKYGVAPVVGAAAIVGGWPNRALAVMTARWATAMGRLQLFGVAVGVVAIVCTCWVLARTLQPADDPPGPPIGKPAPPLVVVESLQERNERIVRDEIVDELRDLVQRFYPPDNPVRVTDVRAFGSEVQIEFQPTHPPKPETELPARLRARYCCYRRHYTVQAQQPGADRWYKLNPAMPKIIPVRLPFGGMVEVSLGKGEYEAAERLFDRLPRDARGEAEHIRFVFGPTGGNLVLPASPVGFTADAGRMWVVDGDMSMYARDPSGRWRYDGQCPGWWLVASNGRLYCVGNNEILTRAVDPPDAPWVRWGDFPPHKPDEKGSFLAVAGDRLYVQIHAKILCRRPVADPLTEWVREENSDAVWTNGVAATPDRLFGHNAKDLLTRPARDASAPWTRAARWPERCAFLAVDGDRLLALGGIGPIYARPLGAGPDVEWEIIGETRDPRAR